MDTLLSWRARAGIVAAAVAAVAALWMFAGAARSQPPPASAHSIAPAPLEGTPRAPPDFADIPGSDVSPWSVKFENAYSDVGSPWSVDAPSDVLVDTTTDPASPAFAAVPEPASLALLSLGVAGLLLRRRT